VRYQVVFQFVEHGLFPWLALPDTLDYEEDGSANKKVEDREAELIGEVLVIHCQGYAGYGQEDRGSHERQIWLQSKNDSQKNVSSYYCTRDDVWQVHDLELSPQAGNDVWQRWVIVHKLNTMLTFS